MRVNQQRRAATGLVVLAVLLGSLWAGGLAAPATGDAADQLAASRSLLGLEPAAPPDRGPALRPSAERPDPGGRLLPLLAGLLAGSLMVAAAAPARRRRSGRVAVRSPVGPAPGGPRAPPRLQPA
jgi:hypothetical protein